VRLFATLLVCGSLATGCVRGTPQILSQSPDKRHFVDVFSEQLVWELLGVHGPGDGSSVPARVRLVDASGHVQASIRVELLWSVSAADITWADDAVEIAHVATWPRR